MIRKLLPIIVLIFASVSAYYPFFIRNLLPIPADTITGLYHPYRDLYSSEYPNGMPFKNSISTDPVRQQYPWRELAISEFKKGKLPLWNQYSMGGVPLLANFQSAVFYPLNILFLLFQFPYAWSILVVLQTVLSSIFLFFYLRFLKLNTIASIFGGVVFGFCGFSVAWLEWNTLGHVALWLPLILLSEEKLIQKITLKWFVVLIFAMCAQFFAGHLQIWFYSSFLTTTYLLVRIYQTAAKENKLVWRSMRCAAQKLLPFIFAGFVFTLITSIQWIPTLQFILNSARDIDQLGFLKDGWFIPWQHLIQFIVPDYFGNPTTLNYWGTWNYGEMVGYIGIIPIIFSFHAVLFRRDRKTLFFTFCAFVSLLFALPNVFSYFPFQLHIPFFSSSQPTRLLFVTDFSLVILSALGFDYFLNNKTKKIFIPIILITVVFAVGWGFVLNHKMFGSLLSIDAIIATKRNLTYSSTLFIICIGAISSLFFTNKKSVFIFAAILILISYGDLFRFFSKYTSFSNPNFLYPSTQLTNFLSSTIKYSRVVSINDEILPPNFSIMHRIQTIDGYDPLYLQRYGEYVIASERDKPDIKSPFGFNRIITPKNINSDLLNLLGVKYILSFSDITSSDLKLVFQEGKTKVFENAKALPRVFFVSTIKVLSDKNQVIKAMFDKDFVVSTEGVVVRNDISQDAKTNDLSIGTAEIVSYTSDSISIKTTLQEDGFLILTDPYYPIWHAKLKKSSVSDWVDAKVIQTDFLFRGVFVPAGTQNIEFYITM